jgi:hypothetical protein
VDLIIISLKLTCYLHNIAEKSAELAVNNNHSLQSNNHENSGKLDTPNTHIHGHSLSWRGILGTSLKSGRVKLVLWTLAKKGTFHIPKKNRNCE